MINTTEKEINRVSISVLKLDPRTRNALIRKGINTVGSLLLHKYDEIKNYRNIGEKGLEDICVSLEAKYGVDIRPDNSSLTNGITDPLDYPIQVLDISKSIENKLSDIGCITVRDILEADLTSIKYFTLENVYAIYGKLYLRYNIDVKPYYEKYKTKG